MMRIPTIAALSLVTLTAFGQQDKGDKEIAFQGTVTIPFQNAGANTIGLLIPRFGYFLNGRNFVGLENTDLFAKGFQTSSLSLLYRYYTGRRGSRIQPYVGAAPGISSVRTDATVQLVVSQSSYNAAAQQLNSLPAAQRPSALQLRNLTVNAFQQSNCLLQVTANVATACTPIAQTSRKVTTSDFQGAGELGLKFFLSRKFAFETSYRLIYLHSSAGYAQDIYDVKASVANNQLSSTFTKSAEKNGQTSGHGGFKANSSNFLLFGFSYVF